MPQQFFYNSGIRKWILQIMRVFSEFQVEYGLDSSGNQLYSSVPVIWGDGSIQAATIQRLNSENMMPSIPMISIYVNNLKFDRNRTQSPTYVDTSVVRTRKYDQNTGTYLPQQGNAYTVKKLMPVPYKLEVRLDIVTSNTQQKLQILEQILPLFNPAIEIQKSDNYEDWESLSYLELQDITWSNRTIPVGQGNDTSYDICTLQFESPIWLTLPAKVSKMGVIFKVITNLNQLNDCNDLVLGTRQVITYNNYGIYVKPNNTIKILNQGVNSANMSGIYGQPLDWVSILGVYGNIRPGVSEIGLTYSGNSNNEITGTITIDPSDSTNLLFNANVVTLPSNTLPSITAIINPKMEAPRIGLPNTNIGQSYLITSNINIFYDSFNYADAIVPSGTLDGVNTIFTLPNTPNPLDSLQLFYNGLLLDQGVDYSINTNNITYNFTPLINSINLSYYTY